MLLKDYVVYYLTGVKLADMSLATFSSGLTFIKDLPEEMLGDTGGAKSAYWRQQRQI